MVIGFMGYLFVDIETFVDPTNEKSGLIDAANVLRKIDGITFVYFDETDVVRHRLVKNIIRAYAKEENHKVKEKKD